MLSSRCPQPSLHKQEQSKIRPESAGNSKTETTTGCAANRSDAPRNRELRRMAAMTARSTELSSTARTCGVPAPAAATTAAPTLVISRTSSKREDEVEERMRHSAWGIRSMDTSACRRRLYTRGGAPCPACRLRKGMVRRSARGSPVRRSESARFGYGHTGDAHVPRVRAPEIFSCCKQTSPRNLLRPALSPPRTARIFSPFLESEDPLS